MLRRNAQPSQSSGAAVTAALDEAAGQAMLGAARIARSKFADRFYNAVRESCTAEQRLEAEQRAYLPLGDQEAAP